MDANEHEQQNAAMIPVPERLASATTNPLSPSDLMISPVGSAATGHEAGCALTIALARISRLPLLHWLLVAINGTLVGELPDQPRPPGTLLERGRFVVVGNEIWAHDWHGHGRRCLLARCADAAAAEDLAARLNGVLRP